MATISDPTPHRWSFCRLGGVDQVRLEKGTDIVRLDELDQKLWVALSCPTKGLEMDSRTLELLDTDGDATVRPPEIVAAIRWLRDVLQDPTSLEKGEDDVSLSNLRQDTAEGKALLASARHILRSLDKDAKSISVGDAAKTTEVLAKAKRNGDGVVPPRAIDDEQARAVATDIVLCMGGAMDLSGAEGIDQARLDDFFAACTAYDAWFRVGESAADVLPFGEATAAAYGTFKAVRGKIDDFFGRCRVAAYDPRALAAVNREQDTYVAAAAKDLNITADEIAHFPLAMIEANKPLPLVKGVNPAWAAAVTRFRDACCKGMDTLTQENWSTLCARFDAHAAWLSAKAGTAVEKLGVPRIREILAGSTRAALQKVIQEDLAVAGEMSAMVRVEKLVRLHRDIHKLLNNYVSFTDFYARRGAIFQAGTLYLDGRSCDMCFHVNDAAKHSRMAPMANTFLAYVDCVRPGGEKMSVACAITAGPTDNVFEGRNGVFYDRKGRDWNATVTKIVHNPISIRQAFWSPYKRVLRAVQEAVAKKAAAADAAATGTLTAVDPTKPPAKKFDVGTIAALGVAVTGITGVFTALLTAFLGLGLWIPLGIIGIVVAISGPSMFVAWLKLGTRNLGPILDANGWAVNSLTRINIPLGGWMTKLPVIPEGSHRLLVDPYEPKKRVWPQAVVALLILACTVYGLYRTNVLHQWFPDLIAAHHSELDLTADKPSGVPGDAIVFTVLSTATTLQVTNTTDRNTPVALPPLVVEAGKATLTIADGTKPGTLTVLDAVSGTSVKITVTEKK